MFRVKGLVAEHDASKGNLQAPARLPHRAAVADPRSAIFGTRKERRENFRKERTDLLIV